MGGVIRHAEPSDLVACLRLMRAFHDALGHDLFPADPVYGAAIFERFTTAPDHVALVYDVGTVEGLLFAVAGWHDLSPIRIAGERLWYADPAVRARAWRPMLQAFEAWAKTRGCTHLSMVALEANATVGRIYDRAGYRPVETHYLKRV